MADIRYEQMVSIVEDYMRALNSLNLDEYLAMFAADCVVRDPYGATEFVGEAGLRQFFEGLVNTWHYFEMRADSIYPGSEDRLAVRWSVSATAKNRQTAEFSGVSIISFAGNKIAHLEAYWNLNAMLQQIRV